jgi:hypothetical protein
MSAMCQGFMRLGKLCAGTAMSGTVAHQDVGAVAGGCKWRQKLLELAGEKLSNVQVLKI